MSQAIYDRFCKDSPMTSQCSLTGRQIPDNLFNCRGSISPIFQVNLAWLQQTDYWGLVNRDRSRTGPKSRRTGSRCWCHTGIAPCHSHRFAPTFACSQCHLEALHDVQAPMADYMWPKLCWERSFEWGVSHSVTNKALMSTCREDQNANWDVSPWP